MALDVYTSTGARLTSPQLPTYVTSLPSGPIDGQEIYYAANATNGVIWHLRYRSASSSSYKWEFVGGAPMYSQAADQRIKASFAAATWGGIDSSDPTITAPLAGDYVINSRASLSVSAVAATLYVGVKVGSTEATSTQSTSSLEYQTTSGGFTALFGCGIRTVAANDAIAQRYQQNDASARELAAINSLVSIVPVRVG